MDQRVEVVVLHLHAVATEGGDKKLSAFDVKIKRREEDAYNLCHADRVVWRQHSAPGLLKNVG